MGSKMREKTGRTILWVGLWAAVALPTLLCFQSDALYSRVFGGGHPEWVPGPACGDAGPAETDGSGGSGKAGPLALGPSALPAGPDGERRFVVLLFETSPRCDFHPLIYRPPILPELTARRSG